MTGPREWRHAVDCAISAGYGFGCRCGVSAVRDAIAAGHRVVIGPDGVEGRLERSAWAAPVADLYRLVPIEEEP